MMSEHLKQLEAESIYIFREAAAQFERPVLLYSIGKDSSVLLHLALKAFAPGKLPFPLLHVDTTWKFKEMIQFRDQTAERLGLELIVHTNQIRGWKGGISEYTDNLETVERYRRMGDTIEGEITLYDPEVLVQPVTVQLSYDRDQENILALRPLFNSCTDTNGPASKVFMDEHGLLNERLPGDPLYWDATDPRPWGTWYTESDRRYEEYKRSQGQ